MSTRVPRGCVTCSRSHKQSFKMPLWRRGFFCSIWAWMLFVSALANVLHQGGERHFCCYADSDNSTAYEVLESYGFPAGLLPDTVLGYDLNDDGDFDLYLDGSCTVEIPNAYPVRYSSTITGNIAVGSLSSLSGVTVKIFFIRWAISSITVDGDDLVFKVGPFSKSYPISNFDENPGCSSSLFSAVRASTKVSLN